MVVPMKELWVVSTGDYSAYSVRAAFTTEALAEAGAALQREVHGTGYSHDPEIETLPLFDRPPVRAVKCCVMFQDGEQWHDAREEFVPEWELRRGTPCAVYDAFQRNEYRGADHVHYRLLVEGTDIERVRKVFSERRAQLVALPWLTIGDDEITAAMDAERVDGYVC